MHRLLLITLLLLVAGLASGANLAGNYSGYCGPFNDGPYPQDGYDIALTVHRIAHGKFRVTGTFVHRIGNPYYASETFPISAKIYHVKADRLGGVGDGEIVWWSGAFQIAMPDGLTGKVEITKERPKFSRGSSLSSLLYLYKGSKSYVGDLSWDGDTL